MKTISVVLLFFVGHSLIAQNWPINEKTSKITFSNVLEYEDKSSDDLYNQVKLWLSTSYNNSNNVIRIDDKENGVIVIKSLFEVRVNSFGLKHAGHVHYDFKFQIKENKLRYEISNIYHDKGVTSLFGSGGELSNIEPDCGKMYLRLKDWNSIKSTTFDHLTNLSLLFETTLFENSYQNEDW